MNQIMCKSINSKGFSSQLQSGRLPQIDHITYEGVFNQLEFDIGPKTNKILDLHFGFARSGYTHSSIDNSVNQYLALFMKGKSDGQQREHNRILNAVIVLDISGSMSGALCAKETENRLELSKKAIILFLEKLKDNDSFGLVIFDDKAETIIPSTLKKDIDIEVVKGIVSKIKTRGGTTLSCGFNEGVRNLKEFLKNYSKQIQNEIRIIMLTDVGDNSLQGERKFLEKVQSQEGIHVTIIGISQDFRSSLCQKLTQIKGFNYFCAVEQEDLTRYLVNNFDYTFFPSAYDIEITIQSQQIKYFEVFGTPDNNKVNQYNNFSKKGNKKFTVTKINTSFPSELKIINGKINTFGGLILLKLKMGEKIEHFEGSLGLRYKSTKGVIEQCEYALKYEFHSEQQFYSQKCLEQAIQGFYFVYEIKNILSKMKNKQTKLNLENKKEYLQALQNLQNIVPQEKKKDLDQMIKVVQKYSNK